MPSGSESDLNDISSPAAPAHLLGDVTMGLESTMPQQLLDGLS